MLGLTTALLRKNRKKSSVLVFSKTTSDNKTSNTLGSNLKIKEIDAIRDKESNDKQTYKT